MQWGSLGSVLKGWDHSTPQHSIASGEMLREAGGSAFKGAGRALESLMPMEGGGLSSPEPRFEPPVRQGGGGGGERVGS